MMRELGRLAYADPGTFLSMTAELAGLSFLANLLTLATEGRTVKVNKSTH